ncbi:isocitrate lyase/phosphoenolpyruvate mutase family protein [Kiloniella laminariae]|uniref:Isocitrate lyase/phosphoenolpyruvate mutase family protein n=1 Tax=Kiloniella laminariae TaxID=454162 RepID=A0ABT4LFT5_9PROT|nr:isocitrate lyase/phosphoenolpyruvate mutase family protein [Kiloniella laminariae]MCZ4279196.1 isocitrate lyase/phosphoenolpyruvate mutase family protein [Kiloniella laminariae]
MTEIQKTQIEKAHKFTALHIKGDPLVLYNIWDAGTAKAIAETGAKAIATGSWSVAAAQGYPDGEAIPLDLLTTIASRIATTIDIPVSIDFEGGYAEDCEALAHNITRIISTGAIGINFEDQQVGKAGLYTLDIQQKRIAAIRQAANALGLPLFINARTDLFLQETNRNKHTGMIQQAIERAAAFKEAGASGFFIPGLVDAELIASICETVDLPVNVMKAEASPNLTTLASLGASRISYGPGLYFQLMKMLAESYQSIR